MVNPPATFFENWALTPPFRTFLAEALADFCAYEAVEFAFESLRKADFEVAVLTLGEGFDCFFDEFLDEVFPAECLLDILLGGFSDYEAFYGLPCLADALA